MSETRKVVRLSLKQQFSLNNFVQAEYAASGLTDVEFSAKASEFLNLPGINARHIGSAREIFSLPSNRDVSRQASLPGIDESRVSLLDERLTSVEKQIRKLFALSEEKAVSISDAQIAEKRAKLYRECSAESGDFRAIALVRWALAGGK